MALVSTAMEKQDNSLPQTSRIEAGQPPAERVSLAEHENPQSWTTAKKWLSTSVIIAMTATIAFCSSIYTSAIQAIADDLGCSRVVSTLGISTFLLGFGSGPLVFAPLSEFWGRNTIYRTTLLLFVVFQLGCALAPNIASLLVFRFFSGFFGSPTVTNSGGTIIDIWPQSHRSVPFAFYAAASFLGPVIAPTIGGFVVEYLSWRWVFWVVLIMGGAAYLFMAVLLPETYQAKLLRDKARRLGMPYQHQRIGPQLYINLSRPWMMLFTEPILFLLSIYMAFVYGILYLDFTAYPLVYEQSRRWSPGISGLSFLGLAVGMAIATAFSPYINKIYTHYVKKLGGPKPEARLPHLIVLSWLIPIGLFWFAWTALPPIHWASSVLAGIPFGLGLVTLFLGITSYLTDCYGQYAASALAANAVLRSLFGAGFPLFATIMYDKLGTPWATSLLGFLALAMAPLPWVFYHFGPRLRAVSKYHMRTMAVEES